MPPKNNEFEQKVSDNIRFQIIYLRKCWFYATKTTLYLLSILC